MKDFIKLYFVILGMHCMVVAMLTMALNVSERGFVINLQVSVITSLLLTVVLFFPRKKNK